jgi:fumarate reductase subunit C
MGEGVPDAVGDAMNHSPTYTPYSPHHPRWYRKRVSTYWWAMRGSYFAFIMRELSSIFVAWFIVYLLIFVRALGQGAQGYDQFLRWGAHPVVVVINVISLAFVVLHAITWFNLAPQAMVVKVGGWRVPGLLIAGSNYAAWAVVTAGLIWIVTRA